MSTPVSRDDNTPLPLPLARRVDEVCWRFEGAWKAGAAGGEPPRLEAYLAEVPEPARAVLLCELLQIEAHHRQAGGESGGPDHRARLLDLDLHWLATVLTPEGPGQSRPGPAHVPHRPSAMGNSPVPGYELLGVLGSGGMGVVYQALQLSLNRVVALKMIQGGRHLAPRALQRFKREAEAVAQLQHPNIVQIHEVGEHDGQPYLALEFVEGGNLDQRLGGTPQPAAVAARLVETLARAVHHAHERGVLHRDLKPANVLLAGERRGVSPPVADRRADAAPLADLVPKVSDFGLAKLLDDDDPAGPTHSGEVLGTPSYMAPEQAEGKPGATSPATDVHGLGAILYELLTGRPPYRAQTALETLLQVRSKEPVSPSQLQPRCPRDLVTICLKCLHKEPHKRYQSARALADDLRRFLDGQPIQARPVGAPERALKWVRRHPATAAWLGLVVALTVLGLSGITWYALRAEERRREAEEAQLAAQQARVEAETALYHQRIAGAFHEWQACDLEQAERLLRPYAGQAQRHWEWGYVHGLCHTDLLTLGGPGDPVTCAAFSPDGRRLATGGPGQGSNGVIKLWDAATGRLLLTFQGRMTPVTCLAFHQGGRQLASTHAWSGSGIPHRMTLWDATTGRAIGPLAGHPGGVGSVVFSPDGRLLAAPLPGREGHGLVRLWDSTTRQEVATLGRGEDASATIVAFSPDGRRLASAGPQGTVWLREVTTHRLLHRLVGSSGIRGVAFSPDGRYLAAAGQDHTVEVWDTSRAERLLTHHVHAGPVTSVAFRPDGLWLASADETGLVQVYEALKRGERRPLRGHTGRVVSVAFSPDGARLATVGADGAAKIWDALREQEFRRLPRQGDWVESLAYSPDGRSLAVAGPLYGRRLGGPADGVSVMDVESGLALLTLEGHGSTTCVAYSPDGMRLASAGQDRTVRLWEATTGKHLGTLEGHTQTVYSVAFDPAGVRLASASEDQTVRIWDVPGGRELHRLRGHDGRVTAVVFSPDGRLLASTGADGTVRLWDAARALHLLRLPAHEGPASGVAFSPDGAWLASPGADRTVVLWEVATGREQFRRPAHTGMVNTVAFSPDGRRLASASRDGAVKLWDVPTGAEAFTLRGPFNNVSSLAFRPDGRQLAVGARGQTWVGLWDVAAPREVRSARAAQAARAWHEGGAAASEKDREWHTCAFHLTHLIAAQPAEADLYRRRGRAFAELGRWDRADADHAQAIARGAAAANVWQGQALLRLRAGDREGYRTACKHALAAIGPTPSADDANLTAWTCVLAPGAGVDPARVVALAEQAVASNPRSRHYLNTLGAALYRAGRFADAAERLEESCQVEGKEGSVEDWLFLALTHQSRGQGGDARQWLNRAIRVLDEPAGPTGSWSQRLQRQLLRAEALLRISD